MRKITFFILIILMSQVVVAGFNGYLKADTQVIVTIGPFVDVGDGFTPQTDIALSGNEAELIKHGATSVVDISGATWAAVTNCRGYYSLTLTTSHTDTEGQITVIVQDDSDCLPVRNTFMVLNDNTYEAFFENASEILTVNATQVGGTSQTANDMSGDINTILTDTEAQDTTTEIRTLMTGADTPVAKDSTPLTAAETEAEVVDALEGVQLDHLLGVTTGVAADSDLETYVVAGSVMAHVLGVGADVTTYKPSTDALEVSNLANFEAEAVDALESFHLDHLLAVDTTVAADGDLETYCVAGSIMAHLMGTGADVTTFKASTDSPEAIRNRGDSAWVTAGANLEVDITKIHGTAITETNSGDLADSFTFFFDVDPVTTKDVDDVGGAAGLEVDVTKIHGTAITETSSGNIAGNFSTFWDNADAATSKVVDNVGASAAGGGSPLAITAGNLGDYKEDSTVYFIWRTVDQGGAAINPTTAGTIKVYKNGGTGEVTAPTGITDTRGFDSLTGIQLCSVDLSANSFYAVEQDYSVVLTGCTIDSQTVTAVLATFSIEKKYTEEFWDYAG